VFHSWFESSLQATSLWITKLVRFIQIYPSLNFESNSKSLRDNIHSLVTNSALLEHYCFIQFPSKTDNSNTVKFDSHIFVSTCLENTDNQWILLCISAQRSTSVMLQSETAVFFEFFSHVVFFILQTSQSVNYLTSAGFIYSKCLYMLYTCATRKPVFYT
jgi:hypothetical protein